MHLKHGLKFANRKIKWFVKIQSKWFNRNKLLYAPHHFQMGECQ